MGVITNLEGAMIWAIEIEFGFADWLCRDEEVGIEWQNGLI